MSVRQQIYRTAQALSVIINDPPFPDGVSSVRARIHTFRECDDLATCGNVVTSSTSNMPPSLNIETSLLIGIALQVLIDEVDGLLSRTWTRCGVSQKSI